MRRILLSFLIVTTTGPASASTSGKVYTPFFQRRAMTAVLAKFTGMLDPRQRASVINTHLAVGRRDDNAEKSARLEELAVELVEATGEFVRFSRANDISEARLKLQSIAAQILRAAGENAVFSKEQSSDAGFFVVFAPAGGLISAFLVGAFASGVFDLPFLWPIAVVAGKAGLLFGSVAMVSIPFDARIWGTTKLAHAAGYSPSMDEFWVNVGAWLKTDLLFADVEVKTLEDFRRLLENEMSGASLDQACANALLSPLSAET